MLSTHRLELTSGKDIFLTFIRTFVLPEALGGVAIGFKSSSSVGSELYERDVRLRAPLARRLRVTIFQHLVWVHVLFTTACATGFGLTLARV